MEILTLGPIQMGWDGNGFAPKNTNEALPVLPTYQFENQATLYGLLFWNREDVLQIVPFSCTDLSWSWKGSISWIIYSTTIT